MGSSGADPAEPGLCPSLTPLAAGCSALVAGSSLMYCSAVASFAGDAPMEADRSGSCGGLDVRTAKEHLLQGVAAQAEPERLERDDLVGRDVPEVHLRAEVLDEPRLRAASSAPPR